MIQLSDLIQTTVHGIEIGQYVRVIERERRDFLCGWDQDQKIAVELNSMECAPVRDWANSPAIAFKQARLEVDLESAIRGDFDRPIGSLLRMAGRTVIYGVFQRTLRPLVAIDEEKAPIGQPGSADIAFTRWSITHGEGSRRQTLFEFGVDK